MVRDDPYEVAAFPAPGRPPPCRESAPRPPARYGITTVADTQLPTLQRILGTGAARQVHDLAHGIDERPVVPGDAPKTVSAGHRFNRDELDPDQHHRTVLRLVQELGAWLCTSGEITQALTLTVTYADRTQTTRGRTLTEATAHTPALATTARELLTGLGLQRARVRTLALTTSCMVSGDLALPVR